MDELKKAIEEKGMNLIGLDDKFRFGCIQCGKCCINREDIVLSAKDVYRISKKLRMEPHEMISEYGELYVGRDSRAPIARLLPRGSVRRCRFLENRKCAIHDAKPAVCAMYPIGRFIEVEKQAGGTACRKETKTQYVLNTTGCNDKAETYTVRQWLEMFDIPVEDAFFIMWQEAIIETSLRMKKYEAKYKKEIIEGVWNVIFILLYLDYDMEEEFMPQFEENLGKVMLLLDRLPTKIREIKEEIHAESRRIKECLKEPQNV